MYDKSKLFLFFCFVFASVFLFLSYLLNIFILDIKNSIVNKDNKDKVNNFNNKENDIETNFIEN